MEVAKDHDNDSIKTFDDLPVELRLKVFGNLKSPVDLKNAWNTSILWKNILDERKQEFLLPDVLPHLQAYLSKGDINNCRKVSKSWEEGVDNFLRTTRLRTIRTFLRSLDDYQKFTSDMRDTVSQCELCGLGLFEEAPRFRR
ncbi:unnamed protein product [Orchesella dallaii]|uniref:F-box domain-containing protein n=1 Tax=Orchesella dallaii TaxID=48710 RepID=A0ABP1PVJ5_9HEXA